MGSEFPWKILCRKVWHGSGASALALPGSSERTERSGNRPLYDSIPARLESGGGGGPGSAGLHRAARQPGQRLGFRADRGTDREAAARHEAVNWWSGGLPWTTSRSLQFPTLPDDGSSLP